MINPLDDFYAKLSPKELRVQARNDNAIAKAGSLQAAYGEHLSRVVPGRGEWAGTFWVLRGVVSDGPYNSYFFALKEARHLDATCARNAALKEKADA